MDKFAYGNTGLTFLNDFVSFNIAAGPRLHIYNLTAAHKKLKGYVGSFWIILSELHVSSGNILVDIVYIACEDRNIKKFGSRSQFKACHQFRFIGKFCSRRNDGNSYGIFGSHIKAVVENSVAKFYLWHGALNILF